MTKKKQKSPTSSSPTNRKTARRQREKQRKQRRYIALAVIGIGLVAIVALAWFATRPPAVELTDVSTEQPPGADGLAWGGPEDASVVIVDYSDFQCGFCGRHALQTVPQLIERYGDNPNVRYEYRPYVLFQGTVSQDAAEAAVCAAEQNLFWPYHDTLFANQGAEASGVFTNANLKAMAAAVGLDVSEFNSCLDSGRQRPVINEVVAEGRTLGVDSTPTFFVNGELVSGAQPASAFYEVIDRMLAEG